MFRRVVGSLTGRFSPRATPGTAPARSLYSLRDLPIGDDFLGAAGVTAAALTAAGALAAQHFNKGTHDDESAARMKEEEMKVRFEDWVKKYNKTYPDEGEKARRFQEFKANVEFMDSHNLSVHKRVFPEVNYFADFTREERQRMKGGMEHSEEYRNHMKASGGIEHSKVFGEHIKELMAKQEKGESLVASTVKQGDTQATRVSA